MLYTIVAWVVFVALIVLVGLPMLPYLLWRKWVKGIPFGEWGRRPDFDLVRTKPVE